MNAQADKANKQIKSSKRPGEIIFDWTEVNLSNSDFSTRESIEAFLNGKMTPTRFREVRLFEILWKDEAGRLFATSRTRTADGNLGPVTTVAL